MRSYPHYLQYVRYIVCVYFVCVVSVFVCLLPGCSKSGSPPPVTTQNVDTPQVDINVLPTTPEEKARSAIATGNWKEAEKQYLELLKTKPGDEDVLYNLAVVADEQKQYSKARDLYSQIIAKNPANVYAHGGLGWVEFRLNNFEKSLEHSQKAVELKPDLVPAWHNIGLAYIALERLENAMEAYEKAAFIDKAGNFKATAINDLNEYLRENPNASPLGHYPLAYYYKMAGFRRFEKISIESFLREVPDHPLRKKAEEHLQSVLEWEKQEEARKAAEVTEVS